MLNNIGLPGLLLIAVVVLVLFGRGKISSLMGEVGKGITAFKKGVSEGGKELEDERSAENARDVTPASERESVREARKEAARDVHGEAEADAHEDAAPEARRNKV